MSPSFNPSGEITELLHHWREGSTEAENQLFAMVTPNLRKVAHYLMKGERKDHSLQATELVSEAYLRLIAAKDQNWQNRKHFFAIAARIMRRYLIDHARRPKAEVVALNPDQEACVLPAADVLVLGRLLDELAHLHPEWCTVVEMKHYLGLTDQEASGEMGIPLRTYQRIWLDARMWLYKQLSNRHG